MAFQPVPGVAEVIIRGLQFGQQTVNTLYFWNGGTDAWTFEELSAVAGVVGQTWHDNMMPNLGNEWVMQGTVATDLTAEAGLQAERHDYDGSVGGTGGGCAPGNVTFAVKFTTGHVGRSYRGRNYVPGLPKGLVGANAISSTLAGYYVAAYQEIRDNVEANTDKVMVVVSRYHNGAERPTAIYTPVSGVAYSDLATDSMRRRLNGRGG